MRSTALLLLPILALASPVAAASFQWPLFPSSGSAILGVTDCGQPTDVFHLDSLTLTPDPPKRGEPLVVSLNGTLDADLAQGAYGDVKVKLGFIKLVELRIDVCEELGKIDEPCPKKEGPLVISHSADIPRELPPGKYRIDIDVTNFDDKHLACISAEFRM
ncbi:ML domain-containing protein [Blyttiomyces helicus]|uniref:Phosphatidylglycerol/phosphatidylinositol transfer protein n=1 Tax=Blyttiomyces helicus TaxID=388810 RepID=A0A4P9WC18_9FUNG|nr:ML domain-containing protein [Blyttiomyces helicus]|eukprot:RKO89185.1 ML domain-containing protein [Blyttiomyces helicus]